MQKAILYLRYSTPEQSEGQSEQRQIQGAERWCKEHDARLVKCYKDLGISGGKSQEDRKGLAALLNDLEKGNVPEFLLLEDVDRLSRMLPPDSLNLISEIRNGKSEIVGYLETVSGNREILRDKNGRILGRFETDTGITRDANGKITGRGSNQLLRLLK